MPRNDVFTLALELGKLYYNIYSEIQYEQIPCTHCNGEGVTLTRCGEERECLVCGGRKTIKAEAGRRWCLGTEMFELVTVEKAHSNSNPAIYHFVSESGHRKMTVQEGMTAYGHPIIDNFFYDRSVAERECERRNELIGVEFTYMDERAG